MKKIITVIGIFASIIRMDAQQDVMVSQYMFNGLFLNPAYAGSHKYFSSTLLHRSQWVGFEGAPKTTLLAIDGPLYNQKMGIGLLLSHDKIGVTSQTDIYANYSYMLKLGDGKLSFGIKAGASNYQAKVEDLTVWDESDNSFSGVNKSAWLPKFGMGTFYFTQKFYIGFSVPSLIAYDPNRNFNLSMESSSYIRKHYYLTSGYVFKVNERVKLKPSLLLKYQPSAPLQADISFSAMYMDMVAMGIALRTNDAVTVMIEYQANMRFRVGYAYDITTSKLRNYSSGSHEIMIGFDFGKDIIKTKTPRFF
ncbi:MAG: type IX secretion system membrane protein PorP/SprF [Bacteroidota bacterium]